MTEFPRFTFAAYARDHGATLALGAFCLMGVWCMLATLGMNAEGRLAVTGFMALCMAGALIMGYVRRARYYHEITDLIRQASRIVEFNLLSEEPRFLEGLITHAAIEQLAHTAGNENAADRQEAQAYRAYVELWIHEVKTPIAAAKLMLADMHGEQAAKLKGELERIESQVEQVLYCARAANLENDYLVRDMSLAACARAACRKNARYLIERGATPVINIDDDETVLADEAWLTFALSQVVVNAAKYGARIITFSSRVEEPGTSRGRTVLEVRDDGPGIPAADVPRVFDRGFTGERGRAQGSATGMGLYLVALLCQTMGIGVAIASEEGIGTRVIFTFPHNRNLLGDNLVSQL